VELPSPFRDQIHHADDFIALADRHFAQHDVMAGIGLQRRHGFRHPAVGGIGLVDEDDRRDPGLFDHPQIGRGQHRGFGVGRHAKHRCVGRGERGTDRCEVFRPARDVDRGPVFIHETERTNSGNARHVERLARLPIETDQCFDECGLAAM